MGGSNISCLYLIFMQPLKLTQQQQREYAQKISDRLERMTMSWDNELREWYDYAIDALDHCNVLELQIPQEAMVKLFEQTEQGLNMNVVKCLCNNLEGITPHQMGYTAKSWAEVLVLNSKVARRWSVLADPVQKAVHKEFEILNKGAMRIIAQA